jgi:hypothetical protein
VRSAADLTPIHRKTAATGTGRGGFLHPAQIFFVTREKNLRYPFLFLNRFHLSESYRGFAVRYRYFLFVPVTTVFWNRIYFLCEIFKFSGRIRDLDAPGALLQSI